MINDANIKAMELLEKVLSNSLMKKILVQLGNNGNKIKVVENLFGEREDLPKGIIVEIYNKDDNLIFQTMQENKIERNIHAK